MAYTSMGDLISDIRKAKNMTQKELADRMGITDKAVSKWERGVSYPDIVTLPVLADILDISVDELLRLQKPDTPAGGKTSSDPDIPAIIDLALNGVGLAMGVATLVLSVMGELESSTAITLLAIGLCCLSVLQLHDRA